MTRSSTVSTCNSTFFRRGFFNSLIKSVGLLSLLSISWAAQAQAPTTQAKQIIVAPVTGLQNQLTLQWTNGNGGNRIVIMRAATGTFTPVDNTTYAANADFSAGSDLDAGGGGTDVAKCIFNGSGTSVVVTGVAVNTYYFVQIYEYNGAAAAEKYLLNAGETNPVAVWFNANLTFTNTTPTYSVPATVNGLTVQAWGGGGGGGGVNGPSGATVRAGGGGSGGAYNKGVISVTPSSTPTVTIGARGNIGSNQDGTAGGTTTFGTVSAVGGNPGLRAPDDNEKTGGGGTALTSGAFNGGAGQEAPPGGTTTNATASGTGGGGPGVFGDGTSGAGGGTAGNGGGGTGGAGRNTNGAGNGGTTPGSGGGGAYEDSNNNQAGGQGGGGYVIVTYSIPTIISATLNYGTGVLVVKVSDPIPNLTNVDGTKFFISNAAGGHQVTLSGAEETSVDVANSTITFTLTEANRLAALAISGVSGGDGGAVVLDVNAGGVTTSEGNLNQLDNNNTVTETADLVAPSVASAAINYGTGVMIVTLTEGVANAAAVDGTKFHINNITGTDVVTLSNAEVTGVNTGARTVTFTLTEANRVAAIAISGTPGGNGGAAILDVDASALTDPRANTNAGNIDNTVLTETADATAPTVTSATLNYGTGVLVVTFSEGIPLANIDGTKFHINNTTGTNVVNLSNAEKTSADIANKTVTFTLTEANRLAARAISGTTGGDAGAVVLDVDAAGISDAATNALAADDDNNTVTETADTIAPSVASATINYGTGVMVVTLTEGVANAAAVDGTKFHINNATGADLINLSNAEITNVNTGARTVTFTLTEANRIAAIAISGTAGGDAGAAILDVDAAGLTDPIGNSNGAAIDNTVLTETADTIKPTIASATLDYGTGILVVTLSETVKDINGFDGTKFHLNDATGVDNVTLSNAEKTSFNQAAKTITFTLTEANRVAALAFSGVAGGNTGAVVLDVDAAGVTDVATNANDIDDNNAVAETADNSGPTVTSATLNYGTGILVVTFSESITLANVDGTKFHINNSTGTNVVTLTNAEKTSVDPANKTATFTLTEANRLAARAISGTTGGDGGAAVLDVDAGGITDNAANALAADDDNNTITETADAIGPFVVSATINYGTGVMVVTITEGVASTAAVDGTKFHINNITGTDLVTLSNAEVTSVNTGTRTVTFTLTEAHRVAAIAISGTPGGDAGAVKLDVDAGGLTDPIGNANGANSDNTTPTETADTVLPVASAPTNTAQRLKSGDVSTSTVASSESSSNIYLVRNGVAAGTQAQINSAITANDAFVGKSNATKDQAYTVTLTASLNDGVYDIVVVDLAGNVSTILGGWLTVDNTAPSVAITRVSATPSNLTTIHFTVTFDEDVTGVSAADFAINIGTTSTVSSGAIGLVTPSTAQVYDVEVTGVVGQTIDILNLDFAVSPTINDVAGNAFASNITGEEEYNVDNTPPALSPDQMSFKDNGAGVETITFTLNEELTAAEGASVLTGFSTSTGTIASAIYSQKGTTNKITLTSSANGQWTVGTTVSYDGTGGYADLRGNLLGNITNHVLIEPILNLNAGDIVFTSVRSDDTDQFSIVILRSISSGTQIIFTDRGWNSTGTPAIEDFTNDGLFTFTATTAISAGTEIVFTSNGSNNFSCSASFGTVSNDSDKVKLEDAGDQILAYQTDGSTITFLSAIKFGDTAGWEADGNPDNSAESAAPAGLSASQYILAGNVDNGAYLIANGKIGSANEVRTLVNNIALWDTDNNPSNVDIPGTTTGTWGSFPSGLTYTIRPKINSVSIPNTAKKVGDVVTATITVDDDSNLFPMSITSGTVGGFTLGSLTRTNATTYTAQFTVTEGGSNVDAASDVPVANLVLQNSLSNSNPAFTANVSPAGNADAIDANSPYVASINRQSTTNVWSTTSGTSASSVVFRITFSEDIQSGTLTTADFNFTTSGSVSGAAVTGISAVTGTSVFDVTVGSYTGTGTLGLNYRDSEVNAVGASVLDILGNPTKASGGAADGSFTGQTYSIVLPSPNNSAFTVNTPTITGNSVTLTWSSNNTPQIPTHFLVMAKLSAGSYPTVEEVVDAPGSHHQIADGAMAQNVVRVAGTNTWTFTGLSSGTSYDFIVYKYTLSSNNTADNIDYETTAPGVANNVVTTTASLSSIILKSSPVSVSSLKDNSGNSASVMQFTIFDDGQDPLSPNLMSLSANGLGQETVVLTLRGELTLAEGASVTGFTSSTGSVASAVYTGKGTTNTITLTNGGANGSWTAATLISYNAAIGNAQFTNATLGKMQSIADHSVSTIADVTVIYNTPGANIFNVPAGVTQITVEVWGAGGSGGPVVNNASYGGASSGGGGGAYSRRTIAVTPLSSYTAFVGAGGASITGTATYVQSGNDGQDSWFSNTSTVFAEGGQGGWNNDWTDYYGTQIHTFSGVFHGLGGSAANGVGDVKFSGGNGGYGSDGGSTPGSNPGVFGSGGGGGSSAGNAANGNNGSNGCTACATASGGAAPTGGAAGGLGRDANIGSGGNFPGGGGGGTSNYGPFASGAGGNGRIVITYSGTHPSSGGSSDWVADNAPFKFSDLVITQGAGNSTDLADWQDIIADAELFDGTNTVPGNVNATDITFPAIPSSVNTDAGFIDDAVGTHSSKTYTLKVWLRDDIDNTLAAKVDGLNLDFQVDPTNLTYNDLSNGNQLSSRLVSTQPTIESGANDIEVVASMLVYNAPGFPLVDTKPQAQIGVGIPFSASTSQQPLVYALDANNNLDLDYNDLTATISNPAQNYGQSMTSAKFIRGKLNLSSFYFTSGTASLANTTQIEVEGPVAPATTKAVSTNVVPLISKLTTVVAGASAPASISSLTTALTGAIAPQVNAVKNFEFVVADDNGANASTFADNDGLPTRINSITIRRNTNNGTAAGGAIFDDWQNSIAGASLHIGSTVIPATVTINSDNITFTGIPNNPYLNAYITSLGNNGLEIANVSNPAAPAHFGKISNGAGGALLNAPIFVYVSGKYAYVASQSSNALEIVDISNPALPVHVGSLTHGTGGALLDLPYGIYVKGNYAYVTSLNSNALEIINISNPVAPVHAGSIVDGAGGALLSDPTAIQVVGNYAYITSTTSGALEIVDISNPAAPTHVGSVTGLSSAIGISVSGDYAYIATFGASALSVVNISDPANPVLTATLTNGTGGAQLGNPRSVTISGKYAYLASSGSNALEIVDISNPAAPTHAGSLLNGAGGANLISPLSVSVFGNFAYVSGNGNALEIVNISNPAAPVHAGVLNNGAGGAILASPTYSVVVSNAASGEAGFIADGTSKTYSLSIWLKNPVDPTLRDLLDNEDFVFEINSENDLVTEPGNASSTFATVTPFNSGDGNNAVNVAATKIDVINQWAINANQNYDAAMSPALTAKARDVNGNLDINYNTAATVAAFDYNAVDGRTYPLANSAVTVTNGNITFNAGLQVTSAGNGFDGDVSRLVISSGGLTAGNTNDFILKYSNLSDIIKDGSLTYTSNIAYQTPANQATNITASDGSTGTVLERFKVRDGGAATDADGTDTKLSSITLKITNYQQLRKLALYDGVSTELGEVDVAAAATGVSGNTALVTFSGITGFAAPDGGSEEKSFEVVATFNQTGITDNAVVSFEVVAISATGVSSQFANPAPTGIVGTQSVDQNKIEVVATQLIFVTPAGASISVPLSPQAQVAARDAFLNLDLDYNGTITAFDNTNNASFTTINNPVVSTDVFAGGLFNFNTNFQFTAGDGNIQLTMSGGAGSGGGVNAGAISGTSSIISVLSSFESTLSSIETASDINYINYQTTDITGSGDGFILDNLKLADGGADLSDVDGAPTVLDDLTIGISNPQSIRKIAIYTQNPSTLVETQIDEKANASITVANGYGTVVFNNLNISAADNDDMNILVLATFDDTPAKITDTDLVRVVVLGATLGTGSRFAPDAAETGSIGGIQTSLNSPFTLPEATASATVGSVGPVKKINVVATSLDFLPQQSTYVGLAEPVGATYTTPPLPGTTAAKVYARDKFAIVDTEFNFNATVSAPTTPLTTITAIPARGIATLKFNSGELDLDGIEYQGTGDGTLTVVSNLLNSSTPPGANVSAEPGDPVEVVHVIATEVAVNTPSNLKGGSLAQTILGVKFTASHATTSQPTVNKFTIAFDNPFKTATTTIFKNFTVKLGTADISTIGGTVSTSTSFGTTQAGTNAASISDIDLVTVDLSANPVELFNASTGAALTDVIFYLVADVDVSAKVGTQALTPMLIDRGYNFSTNPSFTVVNTNIITSKGTAIAQGDPLASPPEPGIIGQTYSFASTRPPVLLTNKGSLTSPYNGQLNVSKLMTQISLEFDVDVLSLDDKAELYNRSTNTKVADLIASNCDFVNIGFAENPVNPLTFDIQFTDDLSDGPGGLMHSFQDDELYYVTIKKGSYDGTTGFGISDKGLNFFGGISSNSTLYFKISSPNPPVLSKVTSSFSNNSTGTFATTFDQRGFAHYLVIDRAKYNANSYTPPTKADILNPTAYALPKVPGTVIANGTYEITHVNEPQTVVFDGVMTASAFYDVWIYAENDAQPSHIETSAPYGPFNSGSGIHPVSGVSPTFSIQIPTALVQKTVYTPSYSLCPDSFFDLTDPIILGEKNKGDFGVAGVQDFNILLPPGYEFDGVTLPTVELIGSDFLAGPVLTWVNNTIVNVKYLNTNTNNLAGSLDKIIISRMRISGALGSIPAKIKRFSGNAVFPDDPTTIAVDQVIDMASISNLAVDVQTFSNTYTVDNDFAPYLANIPNVVNDFSITAIPDNYLDKDPALNGSIKLIPLITPANDYGVTFFTGTGVTNDVLSLNGVAVDAPFDISMIHTDLNGCVSENAVQYLVYDHTSPVSPKLGEAENGTQQALENTNFPANADPFVSQLIKYTDKAGYKLLLLKAAIPELPAGQTQIMQGTAWETQVAKIPVEVASPVDPDLPPSNYGFATYKEYEWDYSHILNAVSESSGAITINPYDNFKDATKNFWRGGSLGKVLFTGTFQNLADLTVVIPFRQEVELFVPPIPLVEVAGGFVTGPSTRPVYNYCEFGDPILISGSPAATAGTSTGFFRIFDEATNAPLALPAVGTAFVDNGNGTATLHPRLIVLGNNIGITNGYKEIRVEYTFQDDNSPAFGTGSILIRVTPNPVPDFVTSMLCEKTVVSFSDNSDPITAPGISITEWTWGFADNNATTLNPNTSTVQNPTHTYNVRGSYPNVNLNVKTNVGCAAVTPEVKTLDIGETPIVDFNITGVAITDNIAFTSTSSFSGNNNIDSFGTIDWDFGDTNTLQQAYATTAFTHTYGNTQLYNVTLTVASVIGCSNSKTKPVIILPRVTTEYNQRFESGAAGWQSYPNPNLPTSNAWNTGAVNKAKMKMESLNEGSVFSTEDNNTDAVVRSALYTPSFDLSAFERPMISFNSFTDFIPGDGVIVQYSVDNKNVADPTKVWTVLGDGIGEGVDWFNAQNLSTRPGDQINFNYGWSEQATATSKWKESKHAIANVAGKPTIFQQPNVVFRFALASTGAPADMDGFAIDNFRVGERTRYVLIENFTNVGNSLMKDATQSVELFENNYLRNNFGNVTNESVLTINYHVGFPEKDPFNNDNPQDPGARGLYYNISATPRARMDGTFSSKLGKEALFSAWGIEEYSKQSLKLADAEIIPTINSDNSIDVSVKALRDLPKETVLMVAIVEKNVPVSKIANSTWIKTGETQFDFVLKKMLPSAAGSRFISALPLGQTKDFKGLEWSDGKPLAYSPNNLALVIFLQNEDTGEIYQSLLLDPIADPGTNTGIEDPRDSRMRVYPSPADKEMMVELPQTCTKRTELQMYDQLGKQVKQSVFEVGTRAKTIDTSELAAGVYLIQVNTPNGLMTKRVVIRHSN